MSEQGKKKRVKGAAKAVPLMLFSSRPEFAGRRLEPLTAGRIVILEGRENPIVSGLKEGDTVTQSDLFEFLLVVSMSAAELAEFSVDASDRDWKVAAVAGSLDLAPDDIVDLWALIEAEKEAIEKARASPKKKRVRRG